MKLAVFFMLISYVISTCEFFTSPDVAEVNLTSWREHRRKKRFIIFANTGVLKLVTGISFPIDLGDKKPWRQLITAYNLQYQFPLPTKPIYWWNKWNARNFYDGPKLLEKYKDEAQEFIYEFAENVMERKGINGRACLQRAICENAQIHINQGLYAEILHRILQPQRNLNADYTEAWHLGKKGMNCHAIYPKAKNCLLDDYLHVREDFMQQHFVKH